MSRPCCLRNHSNYCAVGTYCFLKGRFLAQDSPIFVFLCFSVCYLFLNIFITIFHNTTVNVQPLSPPNFETKKNAPYLKTKNIFICWVLCVCVFYFFIFVSIFRYPFPPLGQNAQCLIVWCVFLIDVGAVFGRFVSSFPFKKRQTIKA